ncbi:MAG: MFS transporter [Myxococcales bacterium]|nr:MFS transporter [Myxococcales bacterium]
MIGGSQGAPFARGSLLTWSFKLILAISFLAFGMEAIVRAIVPLVVLERGGDAVTVGLVATAYSIPSLLFRPLVGSLIDTWRHRLLLRGGMLSSAIIPAFLLLPDIVTIAVVRFLTGIGWGFFSVSNHSLMAKLAPAHRRAEASGIFMSMPALGQLLLPGIAVALYTLTGGPAVPILVAVLLGLGAWLITLRVDVPAPAPTPASAPGDEKLTLIQRLVEPSAVTATGLLVVSFSSWSIFTVFPPVYAQHVGAPVEVLIIYYPIFGLAQTISQPFFGRFADAMGRMRSMLLGSVLGLAGLLVALVPMELVPPMVTFSIGAFLYGLSQSLINPTISALVMERAPKHRMGSAMATYSIGYQLATGISSIAWGAIITSFGFTWLFVVAAAMQILTMVLSRRILAPGRWLEPTG